MQQPSGTFVVTLRRTVSKKLARVRETQRLKKTLLANASKLLDSPPRPFSVTRAWEAEYQSLYASDPAFKEMTSEMTSFLESDDFKKHMANGMSLDPEVGVWDKREERLLAPWHDDEFIGLRDAIALLSDYPIDTIVMVPFGKLGGADFVAGVLTNAVSRFGSTVILRTDGGDWDRPDWYPDNVKSIDLSAALSKTRDRSYALYALMEILAPKKIYNVNSKTCFDMFANYGSQLASRCELYAYYFCADRTHQGVEVGYPIWYFTNIFESLTAALIDTSYLADTLSERFQLTDELRKKLRVVYTPALTAIHNPPVVQDQIASKPKRDRPRLIWAGRLDRQKRFDLLLRIAELMPDVDFDCWGKAVLDAPPDLQALPSNVRMHTPFASYDELPLAESDGWIYTAEWDGLPTILIECAAYGIPITASAVGGVPELVDDETGWPVYASDDPSAYVTALRDMLSDDAKRVAKSAALQDRVLNRHSQTSYVNQLNSKTAGYSLA